MNCQNCQGNQTLRDTTGNLVYLNKVYFDGSQTSCPILTTLVTTPETFTRQLTFGQPRSSCGCGCCDCCDFTVTDTTVFTVTDSRITVTAFSLSTDTDFDAEDVTVDGFPVTELNLVNGQFVADLSGIMDDITKCSCDRDGHFFLAQVPGPWVLGATIILEGTADNGSRTCSFRLCLRTIPGAGEDGITIPGSDNFALYCVEIPCQTGGISPVLVFDFDACATLLNPVITAEAVGDTTELTVTATLVLTPEISLKVTKPALFNLNATEVVMECDNAGQCDLCGTGCDDDCGDDSRFSACQFCDTNGYSY